MITDESHERRLGEPLGGLEFFLLEKFEILMLQLKSHFQCSERTILSKMFAKSHEPIAIFFAYFYLRVFASRYFNYYFVRF